MNEPAKVQESKLEKPLHRLLRRQVRKLKLDGPPSAQQWNQMLGCISEYYDECDSDRAMVTRTLELSTVEMTELRLKAEEDRDRLRDLVDAVGSGIGFFAKSVDGDNLSDHETLSQARQEFVTYIESILESEDQGDSSYAEEHRVRDEFINLADSVIYLVKQAQTAGRLHQQMELAGTIQRLMVPASGLLQSPGLSLSSLFRPAAYCGGDWWSIYQLDQDRTMIVIGDVTGHGVASAVMGGAAKGACDAIATAGPEAILEAMHRLLRGPDGMGRLAMTCAIAVIDRRNSTLNVTCAGHPFPLLIHKDGTVTPIIARGAPLGIGENVSSSELQLPMHEGDALFFYTDGLTEAANPDGRQFGDRRLRRCIREMPGQGADRLIQHITNTVDHHRAGGEIDDDLTLIIAQRI